MTFATRGLSAPATSHLARFQLGPWSVTPLTSPSSRVSRRWTSTIAQELPQKHSSGSNRTSSYWTTDLSTRNKCAMGHHIIVQHHHVAASISPLISFHTPSNYLPTSWQKLNIGLVILYHLFAVTAWMKLQRRLPLWTSYEPPKLNLNSTAYPSQSNAMECCLHIDKNTTDETSKAPS